MFYFYFALRDAGSRLFSLGKYLVMRSWYSGSAAMGLPLNVTV